MTLRDLETAATLVLAIIVSVFASATAGAAMALAGCYRLVWTAFRAHRRHESLASQALLSWSRGYWMVWCVLLASLLVAAIRPLQMIGVWLVGVSLMSSAVLGLSTRYTWDRFTRVTPESHPASYWLLVSLGAVLGPIVVAGVTYRFGEPLGTMCVPWNC